MANILNILIIDDSEDDALLLMRHLKQHGVNVYCERVDNPDTLRSAVAASQWDVILCDVTMPRLDALTALEVVRAGDVDIPFIVVSGTVGEERLVELMKAGAHDIIVKDRLSRLVPAINREIEDASVRQERREIEAQLLQAQKMEVVGQLTGGVAHDFNNFLTVIMGNACLLRRRLPNEDAMAARNLDAILGAAQRGASLTHRLLAFSRNEEIQAKIVNGSALISGMLDMVRQTLGGAIQIETRLEDESMNLLADPNLLEAALLNLAVNARDAMPHGGTLTISLENSRIERHDCGSEPRTAPGEFVAISVTDTGSGIPAEIRDRIFEPFFTTKEVGKGTGLGLSMVFGFVRKSGGLVEVDSEVGRGTVFRLLMPKAEGTAAEAKVSQHRQDPAVNGRRTILVVEDEPEVRAIAVAMLGELGYRVIASESGPDALAKLDCLRDVDLLFTDIVMAGGMNGLDLVERVRERSPDLKVLVTTGYAGGAAANRENWPDDIAVLAKPYAAAELAEMVSRSLDPSPRDCRPSSEPS